MSVYNVCQLMGGHETRKNSILGTDLQDLTTIFG